MIITLDEGGSVEFDYAGVLSVRSSGAVRIRRRSVKPVFHRAPDGSAVPADDGAGSYVPAPGGNQCRHSSSELNIVLGKGRQDV